MAQRKSNDWGGLIYSTDENVSIPTGDEVETETLVPDKQRLKVSLDKKARKGKAVTLVHGFVGKDEDLQRLGQLLKKKCAVGGSAKDGEIVIQGDFRLKIQQLLSDAGYNVKISG